ncbi:MAG: hypothetical protein DI611_15340 [Brachybacterium faecium]|nr:MAG: hypothetical protein DI611_15340 [Brachybacterium faecium]
MRYAPILKARKAELEALHTQQIDCHVEPIFEIQHDDWDPVGSGKSIATDAASFLDKIRRQWLRPCFVDLIRIAHTQADREAWWRYLDASLALPGTPRPTLAPVLTTGDGPNVLAAAEPLAQAAGKALVRIPAPCSDLSGLAHFLSICAQSLNLQSHRVELLIDWGLFRIQGVVGVGASVAG